MTWTLLAQIVILIVVLAVCGTTMINAWKAPRG